MIPHKKIFFLILPFCAFAALLGVAPAQAKTVTQVQTSLVDKMIYQGVYKCYTNGMVRSEFRPILGNYYGIDSFLTDKADDDENYIPFVTGMGSSTIWQTGNFQVKDSGVSCQQLFDGGSYSFGGTNKSLLTVTGHTAPQISQPEETRAFLDNMGYTIEVIKEATAKDSCFALKYTYTDNEQSNFTPQERATNQVCQNANGDLRAEGGTTTIGNYTYDSGIRFEMGTEGGIFNSTTSTKKVCLQVAGVIGSKQKGCATLDNGEIFGGEWLISAIKEICGSMTCDVRDGTTKDGKVDYSLKFDASLDSSGNAGGAVASDSLSLVNAYFTNGSTAAIEAIKFLKGEDKYKASTDLQISDAEKRILYQQYLTSYYGVTVDCTQGVADGAYDGKINWYDADNSAMKTCHYDLSTAKNKDKPVNGVVSGWFSYESIANLDALLEEFKTMTTDYSEEELEILEDTASDDIYDNGVTEGNSKCETAAGSLGWIICPLLEGLSNAAKDIYSTLVVDYLKMDTSLF